MFLAKIDAVELCGTVAVSLNVCAPVSLVQEAAIGPRMELKDASALVRPPPGSGLMMTFLNPTLLSSGFMPAVTFHIHSPMEEYATWLNEQPIPNPPPGPEM